MTDLAAISGRIETAFSGYIAPREPFRAYLRGDRPHASRARKLVARGGAAAITNLADTGSHHDAFDAHREGAPAREAHQ